MLPTPRPSFEPVSQAALRIVSDDPEAAFASVRALLLDWLSRRTGRELPTDMARGATASLDHVDAIRTETVGITDPPFWAFRHDDLDTEHLQRRWVTEASLAVGPRGVSLGYRLHVVTSREPATFHRSVPRFMRDVADRFTVTLDGVEVGAAPVLVETADEVDELARLLEDPVRTVPVIAVSVGQEEDEPPRYLVDPARLARDVLGTAHVRALTWSSAFALTDRLGKRVSAFQGAVRIWRPDVPVEPANALEHPLFLATRLLAMSSVAAHALVVDTVLRNSAARKDSDSLVPSFAMVRQTALELARNEAGLQPADELLAVYEAENALLRQNLTQQHAEFESLMRDADERLAALRDERDEANAEIQALLLRLDALAASRQAHRPEPAIPIPQSFGVLKAWVAEHLGSSVHVMPRALRMAKDSEYEDPPRAYRALLLLRDAYVPMKAGNPNAMAAWSAGLHELGLDHERAFSGTRAGEFGDEYFVEWRGRRRQLDWYLKGGGNTRDPRRCFRVYFFWCEETRAVVVGAFPGHLTNRLT